MLAGQTIEMQSEETPLALQRLWSMTRARLAGTSTATALAEEPALVEETLSYVQKAEGSTKSLVPTTSDCESDSEDVNNGLEVPEVQEAPSQRYWGDSSRDKEVLLDASTLGDVPAVYRVPPLAPHQLPVIGVYIDPRVRTGFRYKVRPMQTLAQCGVEYKPTQDCVL